MYRPEKNSILFQICLSVAVFTLSCTTTPTENTIKQQPTSVIQPETKPSAEPSKQIHRINTPTRIYTAEDYFSQAQNAYTNRKYDQVIKLLDESIKLKPKTAKYYLLRGKSYNSLGYFERAMENYNLASRFNSELEEIYYVRGTLYVRNERYDEAFEDFEYAIFLNPEYADVYYNRGVLYAELNLIENARNDFGKAIKYNPAFTIAYFNRAIIHFGMDNYEPAIEDLNSVIRLNANFAVAYQLRGQIFERMGKIDQSEIDFEKAEELGYEK